MLLVSPRFWPKSFAKREMAPSKMAPPVVFWRNCAGKVRYKSWANATKQRHNSQDNLRAARYCLRRGPRLARRAWWCLCALTRLQRDRHQERSAAGRNCNCNIHMALHASRSASAIAPADAHVVVSSQAPSVRHPMLGVLSLCRSNCRPGGYYRHLVARFDSDHIIKNFHAGRKSFE